MYTKMQRCDTLGSSGVAMRRGVYGPWSPSLAISTYLHSLFYTFEKFDTEFALNSYQFD